MQAVERIFSDGFDLPPARSPSAPPRYAVTRVEAAAARARGSAEAMPALELDGSDAAALLSAAAGIDELAESLGASPALVADDAAGQRRLWQIRRRIGEAVKQLSVYKEADTVVPRAALADLVQAARAAADRQGLTAICYGHAGDGNLHVNLLRGELPSELWIERRDRAEEELFRRRGRARRQDLRRARHWLVQRRFLLGPRAGRDSVMRAVRRCDAGAIKPGDRPAGVAGSVRERSSARRRKRRGNRSAGKRGSPEKLPATGGTDLAFVGTDLQRAVSRGNAGVEVGAATFDSGDSR